MPHAPARAPLVLAADLVRAAIAQRPHQVFVPAPLTATRRDLHAGLVQPDRTTCGSACLVVARMLGDRDYARWLETGEITGRTRDPRPRRRRFADEVLATHVRTSRWYGGSGAMQVAWPRALGTAPWALAHELDRHRRDVRPGHPPPCAGGLAAAPR